MVSAHICYWLEQRANTTGHGVKSRQAGVGILGGRDQIWGQNRSKWGEDSGVI